MRRLGKERTVIRVVGVSISLDVDNDVCMEDIGKGDSSLKAFLDESIGERESRKFIVAKLN